MKKTLFFFIAVLLYTAGAGAQTWNELIKSDNYYYGEGFSDTYEKARSMALSAMTGMIAAHMSNDFAHHIDEMNANGEIDQKSQVLNCLKTYSQATLNNVKEWVVSDPPECRVRCYIERSELERVFENRIAKAKSYYRMAGVYLGQRKIGVALQFYYWAYSLIRSVQRPTEVKDDDGNLLVVTIPSIIEDIADNVNITFDRRTDNFVDFLFTYEGKPVASIDFTYNNGQDLCYGKAKDGRGMVEVKSTHDGEVYHINVEYEYKNNVACDAELESVLNVVPRKVFSTTEKKILGRKVENDSISIAKTNTSASHSVSVMAKSAKEQNADIVNAQPLNQQNLRELTVTSFEEKPFDTAARDKRYKVLDDNGELFSIIKLVSNNPDDNLRAYSFDFGLCESRVKEVDGDVWVYVQRNAIRCTIKRKGYKTMKFELPLTVKPGCVYEMVLSAEAQPINR